MMLKVEINTVNDLAKAIRETRKRQKMSQIELAGISRLGRRFISEIERGKSTAQVAKVLLILNILGIRLEAISEWDA